MVFGLILLYTFTIISLKTLKTRGARTSEAHEVRGKVRVRVCLWRSLTFGPRTALGRGRDTKAERPCVFAPGGFSFQRGGYGLKGREIVWFVSGFF